MAHISGIFDLKRNYEFKKKLYGENYEDNSIEYPELGLLLFISSRNNEHDKRYLKVEKSKNSTVITRGFTIDEFENGHFSKIIIQNDGFSLLKDFLGIGRWFYFERDNTFIFSTSLWALKNLMCQCGYHSEMNENAFISLAGLGMLAPGETVYEDVKLLTHNLSIEFKIQKKQFKVIYHKEFDPFISNVSYLPKTDQIVSSFNESTASVHKFNKKINKPTLAGLSGGLDSRMSILSYEKQFGPPEALTFSESNTCDDIISKEIAYDLKIIRHFIPLDNGDYLKEHNNWRYWNKLNDGTNLTFQSAHVLYAYSKIDNNKYGLILTGMIGDILLSRLTFSKKNWSKDIKKASIGFFPAYIDKIDYIKKLRSTNTENSTLELWKLRMLNGTLHGDRITSEDSASYSPFYSKKIWDLTLKIGHDKLVDYRYYFEWMKQQDQRAFKYKWDKVNAMPKSYISFKIYKYLHYFINRFKPKTSMNPFELWFNNNPEMKNSYIYKIEDLLKTHDKMESLFGKLRPFHKFNAVKVLALFNILDIYDQYLIKKNI